jgi:hypothetical protein
MTFSGQPVIFQTEHWRVRNKRAELITPAVLTAVVWEFEIVADQSYPVLLDPQELSKAFPIGRMTCAVHSRRGFWIEAFPWP